MRRVRVRTGLSDGVLLAVTAALSIMAVGVVAFAGVTEDVTARNGLATTDPRHLRIFTAHRSTTLVHASRLVTEAGALAVLVPLAMAVFAFLWWRRAALAFAVAPMMALLAAGAVTSLLKHAVGRPRPPLALRLVTETEPSFPSGHATDSTAFYVAVALVVAVVVLRRPLARLAAVVVGTAVPTAVGLSRLVLGVHWPTDVMGGWALGGVIALAVVLLAGLAGRLGPAAPANRVGFRRLVARLATPRHGVVV